MCFVYILCFEGQGELKKQFEEKLGLVRLSRVAVRLPWLEQAEYPLVIGCADLGVSLHSSTSGVDLPMKVMSFSFPKYIIVIKLSVNILNKCANI